MYALKEEQASFTIQVGYIFTLLTFVVIVSFTVFIITTSFASSGSDLMAIVDLDDALCKLSRIAERLTRYSSHFDFLSSCQRHSVIPKGMQLKFGKDALPKSDFLHKTVDDAIRCASLEILSTCKDTYSCLISRERDTLHVTLYNLQQSTNFDEFEAILNQFHFKLVQKQTQQREEEEAR